MKNQVTFDSPEQFMDAARLHDAGVEHLLDEGTIIVIRKHRGREFKFSIATRKERGGQSISDYYDSSFFNPG